MSELQDYFSMCETGAWADEDPKFCPCRDGWFLSQVDTWHKCRFHNHGQPHPEDESEDDPQVWGSPVTSGAYEHPEDFEEHDPEEGDFDADWRAEVDAFCAMDDEEIPF